MHDEDLPLRAGLWPVAAAMGGAAAGASAVAAWLGGAPLAAGAMAAALLAAGAALVQQGRADARRSAAERAQQQAQLTRLERRARQLDEAEHLVSVGSFDWFPPSGELHWSEQHFRQWGLEPGSVQPSLEVFVAGLHPDDAERVQHELQRALRGEIAYDCRHRVRRPDGSVRHVHARGEVFFDAQRQPVRMIGAVLDVTERVQAEATLRVHGFVLDAIGDPVSVLDGETMAYRLTNKAWQSVSGLAADDAVGRHLDAVFPNAISSARREALQRCLVQGQVQTVRTTGPAAGQSNRIFETRYFPFSDPEVHWHGAVMISRDVTEDEAVRAALAGSVDNLRLTLNTIGDAIFATEAEGPDDPVLFANDQLLQLWRIPPERAQPLTARTIMEFARRLFPDPAAESARIDAIIGGSTDSEDRVALNDGRELLRRCRRTVRGGRELRVWAFRDVTAEVQAVKRLAAAEAQQRTLLAAFPGFIWVVDEDQRLAYMNPRAAAVYLPHEPAPNTPLRTLVGEPAFKRLQPFVERALAGETLSLEWQRLDPKVDAPEHLLVRVTPGSTPDGRRLCYGFGVDITSLKQAEAALVAARDEAQRANVAKTQFLSSMSHELRTPLNAVIGFSQVLGLNSEHNLSARQLRQLGDIRRAGQHLLALINDLLDLARIEAGRTTLERVAVDLQPLADECVHLVGQSVQRALQLRVAPGLAPARVLADRTRLKQVLINLLSNAAKYNTEGGWVELRWAARGAHWRIEVADDGPGLSPQQQERLFRPFERLGAETTDVVGTGIGLALSRHLVELMQGRIGVDSEPGRGACFWLELQATTAEADASAPARPPAAPDTATPARLLYVDDNPVNLALMEGLFDGLGGWRLDTCGDAAAALEHLRTEACDALLVDLQMPGTDGFQLFDQVRALPAGRRLPMVAVSADASAATADRCLRLGFVDFVPKPLDADRLFAAIGRALGRTPVEPRS